MYFKNSLTFRGQKTAEKSKPKRTLLILFFLLYIQEDVFCPLLLFCVYYFSSYYLNQLTEGPEYFYFLSFIITWEINKLREWERKRVSVKIFDCNIL